MNQSRWLQVALFNFFVAAVMGVLMRLAFVTELPWMNFKNVMHGHSHIAMLGWIYMALYALIYFIFIDKDKHKRRYSILFWWTQISVLGMMVTFPMKGYWAGSIAFSTMHVFLSVLFCYFIFKDLKPKIRSANYSTLFMKTGLLFMILSCLALVLMPVVIVTGMRQSAFYYAAIQFFLHFQFNGFYLFTILALFLKWLEVRGIILDRHKLKAFYILLSISCILTYVLAVTWSTPLPILFWINSVGVMIQLLALGALYRAMAPHWSKILHGQKLWVKVLLALAFFSFCVKILVQAVVIIPTIAVVAYTIRNYVIGFIHLILLGAVTTGILGFSIEKSWISVSSRRAVIGMIALLSGLVLSELLLFLQGSMLWGGLGFISFYYEILFGVSLLMPFGLLFILLRRIT